MGPIRTAGNSRASMQRRLWADTARHTGSVGAVGRRLSCALLVVVGSALLASWGALWWVQRNLYDTDAAVALAVRQLDDPGVRQQLADRIVGFLPAAGPLDSQVRSVTLASIDTDAFRAVFAEAVRQAHSFATDQSQAALTLDLSPYVKPLRDAVGRTSPAFAAQIPEDLTLQIDLVSRARLTGWFDLFARLPTLSVVAGISGAVAVAAAIGLARSRLATVGAVGLATGAWSGLMALAVWAAPSRVVAAVEAGHRAVAERVVADVVHGLFVQTVAAAAGAAIVGAGLIAASAIVRRG